MMNNLRIWLIFGLITLGVLMIILPFYGLNESRRVAEAQTRLRLEAVAEGQKLYAEHCAECHGPEGRGDSFYPTLASEEVRRIARDSLVEVVKWGVSGSEMTAWGITQGGVLTDPQIDQLVTMLKFGDWQETARVVAAWQEAVVSEEMVAVAEPAEILEPEPEPTPTPAELSKMDQIAIAFSANGCSGCHTIPEIPDASGRTGPDLAQLNAQITLGGDPDALAAYLDQHLLSLGYLTDPATGVEKEDLTRMAEYLLQQTEAGP
ncbi:MAG: c-type cytochrome [Anaerolineales bacterium]|nr:c-type cytochrome [Anaerolineales bacterium]